MSGDRCMVVEVVPDVTGIERSFDYVVPDALVAMVEVGSRVRVNLNGRRIAGWVVSERPKSADDPDLKPILKWSGVGPDSEMVDLCRWAARRWCVTKLRPFLVAASSATLVGRPAPRQRTRSVAAPTSPAATEMLDAGGGVLRLPPTLDQLPAVLSAASIGPVLVVCASVDTSRILAARLRRAGLSVASMPHDWAAARGGVDVTIGARSAAFAPCPDMAAAIILDEHEESLQEERMPTWHARDVLEERCKRAGAPLVLVSPCPTAVGQHGRRVLGPSPERERAGWPEVRVIDRGAEPSWSRSLLSSELIALARDPEVRLACVLNTKGVARLLGCRECGALVRCETCESTMSEIDEGRLECTMCGTSRPKICSVCASTSIVRLRPGVTRLREELERAANRAVLQIDAADETFDDTRHDLFIGTNASLLRLRHIDAVVFLDFDRELLAPRFAAHEQAMALVVRAARLVGPRARGGAVLLQTSLAEHDVIRAAVSGRFDLLASAEVHRREILRLPPFSALAVVEGEGVRSCFEAISVVPGIAASLHRERILIRADSHELLSSAWAALPQKMRSSVRIEVDPLSV